MEGKRMTTAFKLPNGARKKVLPAIYLTGNYAPIIPARTKPAVSELGPRHPTVEEAGDEEDGARVPFGRRLDVNDPLLVESTDHSAAQPPLTRTPYSQPFVDERRTRIAPNWTRSGFSIQTTEEYYPGDVYESLKEHLLQGAAEDSDSDDQSEKSSETDSVQASPERYRSDSAGPFRYHSPSASPSESATPPASSGSHHRNFAKSNEKKEYVWGDGRGRTMYRIADYYDKLRKKVPPAPVMEENIGQPPSPAPGAAKLAAHAEIESLIDVPDSHNPFKLGQSRAQTPAHSSSESVSIMDQEIDTAACDERLAKVIDSFRPYHQPSPEKLEVASTQHRGIHESHLHLIPQEIQDLLLSGNRQDLINRGPATSGPQYDRNVNREDFNRDPNAPILANENWDLPGMPRDPDGPPVYFTNVGPFQADEPEIPDHEPDRSPTPRPGDFQPHRNRNNVGPPPNTAVDFKTTIVRSYKDWGLPVRDQAYNYTTRIMLEAEKAKREGVIIPGLEESMKPLHHVDRPHHHQVIYEEPSTMKRLDVTVYQFPDNVDLSDISFALQNSGSMQWIRYDKDKNAAHCRFIHEWSARQFATGKSVITAPLRTGEQIQLRIHFPPASIDQGKDSDWLPDMTRRIKFGPVNLEVFREFTTEVDDMDIDLDDDAEVMAALVRASVDEEDVYHAVKFEHSLSGAVTCWIEFGEIRHAIKFMDGLKVLNLVNSNNIVFDRDPCQGFAELKMLNDKRTAERERQAASHRALDTRSKAMAAECGVSEYELSDATTSPRHRASGRSRNAIPSTHGMQSRYAGQYTSRASSRERGRAFDGPSDYERDMMRRRELIALQLAAQDQIKDTYNSGGMRAVNSAFGNRLRAVNRPAALRKPAPRRGF